MHLENTDSCYLNFNLLDILIEEPSNIDFPKPSVEKMEFVAGYKMET